MNEELKIIISAQTEKLKAGCKDAVTAIKGVDNEGKKAGDNSEKHFEKMGKAAKKAGAVMAKGLAAGLAAAATGVVALTKAATEGYAEYEQLVGGVDTLFKESSQTIQNYANEAYKTAGMSANEYMSTITGFSASMLQSLEGDTKAAAEASNQAVIDMSDNANKMGTSMESIQNAYQGFAKQNYTMLDNLKLGYGGTKKEMQRLLDDAEKISGIKYDISSFNDVTAAIHVVQTEMGITGTTAKEAAATLSGSTQMMKSAWNNLVVGIANDNADFEKLISNLVESVSTVLGNFIPRIEVTLGGIVLLIQELVPQIINMLPGLIETLMPILTEAVVALVTAVAEALPQIIESLVGILPLITEAILGMLPTLITLGIEMIVAIIQGISETLPTIIEQIVAILPQIVDALVDGIPLILEAGIELLMAIVEAIPEILPPLIEALPEIIDKILDMCIDNLPMLIQAAIDLFLAIVEAIPLMIPSLVSALPKIISSILNALIKAMPTILKGALSLFLTIVKAIPQMIPKLASSLGSIISTIKSHLVEKAKSALKFDWSLPKLKLPHFSISGKFSLDPPSIPKFKVDWYAQGGVFDTPTLFPYGNGAIGGLGEAGAEAIVPLENNTKWLDRIAERLQGGNRPIYLQVDGKTFAETSVETINQLTRQRGSLPLVIA